MKTAIGAEIRAGSIALTDDVEQLAYRIADAMRRMAGRTGWTDIQQVILGNGEYEPVVVVPDGNGLLYCHRYTLDTKEVLRVLNTNGSLIFDNSQAGIEVRVGRAPHSDMLEIIGITQLGLARTGGALPSQVAIHSMPSLLKFKNNLSATANPTVNDDTADGYQVGSLWLFGTKLWILSNATEGAAVWVQIGGNNPFDGDNGSNWFLNEGWALRGRDDGTF